VDKPGTQRVPGGIRVGRRGKYRLRGQEAKKKADNSTGRKGKKTKKRNGGDGDMARKKKL